jgi:hypothetical protein
MLKLLIIGSLMLSLHATSILLVVLSIIIVIILVMMFTSDENELVFFDPNYWILDLGIALNRYEEYTADYAEYRVRKELVIGLLILSVKINYHFSKPMPENTEE